MKKSDLIAFVAGIVIAYLLIDNLLKRMKIEELKKEIDENKNLNIEIRSKLMELLENNKELDPRIANELGQIVALHEIKQDSTAILKMGKIIENLLKELYGKDPSLIEQVIKNGRKAPSFSDYLEHARKNKLITSEDFHLLSLLKIIRNQEAHELDIHKEKSRMIAAFIAGISFILKLCNILKKREISIARKAKLLGQNIYF